MFVYNIVVSEYVNIAARFSGIIALVVVVVVIVVISV